LYALARRYGQGLTLIARLASEESIPQDFLENILLALKRQGFVETKMGKGGGVRLAAPPETIMVGPVIRAMEGPLAPLPCASETAYRKCNECIDDRFCGTRIVMRKVRDAIAAILDKTSLAEVCAAVEEARERAQAESGEAYMYHI
jgi:Rrf2 family protein